MSTEKWRTHIAELIRNGEKLAAIKAYREATGADLVTAKTFVEELERTLATGALPPSDADQSDTRDILTLLANGQKIEAIKRYRERHRVGLKEAKDAVEALAADAGLPASRGCLRVILLVLAPFGLCGLYVLCRLVAESPRIF
jgi:ribosomal protein L7/L12